MKSDRFRISDTEMESIKFVLEQYGYSEDDFELVDTQEGSRSEEERTPGAETMYVIYKPTGFRRMYDGASWETEFKEDVKNRIFKPDL